MVDDAARQPATRSRLGVTALTLAFLAFAFGIAAPALDPAVLKAQALFAQRAVEPPAEAREPSLRAEAGRWAAGVLRRRNEAAEARGAAASPGVFGTAAPYVVPAQILLALVALGLALIDWLRTRLSRVNSAAALVAGAAIVLPFAWSAIAAGMTVAAIMIALIVIGQILG